MSEYLIPKEVIEQRIFLLRNEKVMIDRDLAQLYEVTTKALNQAVKRNKYRFPRGFIFQLNKKEKNKLVTNCDRFESLKHSTHLPFAFTELGVAMLSSVLKSKQAIQVNIQIMKTFVYLRRLFSNNRKLAQRLNMLEDKYDKQFKVVFNLLHEIINPPVKKISPIGFTVKEKTIVYGINKISRN